MELPLGVVLAVGGARGHSFSGGLVTGFALSDLGGVAGGRVCLLTGIVVPARPPFWPPDQTSLNFFYFLC